MLYYIVKRVHRASCFYGNTVYALTIFFCVGLRYVYIDFKERFSHFTSYVTRVRYDCFSLLRLSFTHVAGYAFIRKGVVYTIQGMLFALYK